jgi:hypothetical protein
MVVLDGCYFIRLVGFWLGYAKVSTTQFSADYESFLEQVSKLMKANNIN